MICSDKTGTLTEGKMTMVNMWTGGMAYDVGGEGFDPAVSKITRGGVDVSQDVSVRTSLLSALLCSNTTLSKVKDPECGEGSGNRRATPPRHHFSWLLGRLDSPRTPALSTRVR